MFQYFWDRGGVSRRVGVVGSFQWAASRSACNTCSYSKCLSGSHSALFTSSSRKPKQHWHPASQMKLHQPNSLRAQNDWTDRRGRVVPKIFPCACKTLVALFSAPSWNFAKSTNTLNIGIASIGSESAFLKAVGTYFAHVLSRRRRCSIRWRFRT